MKKVGLFFFLVLFVGNTSIAQTTIVDYDFNSAASYPVSPSSTAAGVTCSGTSTEAFATSAGVVSGGGAFTANGTAGFALHMNNSSGTDTRYFQFQLGGANLNTYCCYKIYLQAQRSASGAATVSLEYSTDGSTYTTFGTSSSPGNGAFAEVLFDLCGITAINNQAAVYFRLSASAASGTGTLRIDNFEVQATTSCPCSIPTTASGVSFSGVSTTGFTTSWTGGNGYGDVVVISTSNVAPTATGGTTYNANTVYGSGDLMGAGYYTVYNGTSTSVSITGLTCNTKYYIYVFEYNNTGTSSPCYTTSATNNTTTSACPACVTPTTASGVSFSGVSTTGLTTSWTGGSGYGDVVVISTSNVAPSPTGGTTYNANTVYGSGDLMGAGYYTVYNGTGTSVTITGLTCNITYYIYVFEYNNTGTSSPCYTTSATNNTATSACSGSSPTYPVLTGIVVDGCNSFSGSTPACGTTWDNTNCVEGRSEIAFFTAGTTAITAAKVQAMTRHAIDYYTTAWSTLTYWSGISMNNAATTTYLNANGCNAGTCGTCFQNAWTTGIPAGATFIMVADYYCLGSTNYANLCSNAGTSPIYVIYFGASTNDGNNCNGGTSGTWDPSGNYTNYSGTPSTKGIAIDMSSLVAGAPKQYYTYSITSLANCGGVADGAGIAFDGVSTSQASPITPNAYTSCACNIPIVLPTSILNFIAKRSEENILISWETATETNSDYFDVEYSLDGENFIPYKEVKAAGNSTEIKNYDCLFINEVVNETPYFRLKQVDYNGNFKYSNIVSLSSTVGLSSVNIYYNTIKDKIVTKFKLDAPTQVSISLYDITGREVYSSTSQFNEGDNQFLITSPDVSGVYILVYQNGSAAPVHKKVMVTK